MRAIPEDLRHRPFSRDEARAAGLTSRMLDGKRFVRIYDGVWRCADHDMTEADWLSAAAMALPPGAHLTGITRLQQLGLDYGPRDVMHFVAEGDLHRDMPRVFLHRTVRLAPLDEVGVCVAGAYIAYCLNARVIDAIKVGDWLLHHGHMTLTELRDLAFGARWRDGAFEALWVSNHLDERSRSLKESETRSVLDFAGLTGFEVNEAIPLEERITVIGDLVWLALKALVEYEGRQHAEGIKQFHTDIDRYAALRRGGISYVQVTNEKLSRPRQLVSEVHAMLVRCGYDGPEPAFGQMWRSLYGPISQAFEGTKRDFMLRYARGEVS